MLEELSQSLMNIGLWHLTWGSILMWVISFGLLFLAIKKGVEPLLLVPISFGIFIANFPLTGLTEEGGLFYMFLKYGIYTELIPPLIFLGLGAMTEFGPVIANPKTLLLGAAAQLGVFGAFFRSPFVWFFHAGSSHHQHHRGCRRTHFHLSFGQFGPPPDGGGISGGLLLHGVGTHHFAAHM